MCVCVLSIANIYILSPRREKRIRFEDRSTLPISPLAKVCFNSLSLSHSLSLLKCGSEGSQLFEK